MQTQKTIIHRMLRVNQSGEIGADAIYRGQLALLKRASITPLIREMHQQELKHLSYFNTSIVKNRVRPSLLLPLWYSMGYGLGLVTAAMGEKYAMKCTEAVETVIGKHYNEQVRELVAMGSNPELNAAQREELKAFSQDLTVFRDEELEHLNHAKEFNQDNGIVERIFKGIVSTGCKAAVKIAQRL